MKFCFRKFGFIDTGSVELGDLTLICGPNNAGKTYATYCIYGFLKHFKGLVDLSLSQDQIKQLQNEGSISVELSTYKKNINKYVKGASKEFSGSLEKYFNAPDDFFSKTDGFAKSLHR